MRMWKVMTVFAPLALALGALPAPVHAQGGQGPCREDVQKFCPGIQPGGGRFRDCLRQHAAELSPACQEHLKQTKAKVAAWRQACESDVQKFCSQVAPGRGNIIKCLRKHQADLSQACQAQLAQHPHGRHAPPVAPPQ